MLVDDHPLWRDSMRKVLGRRGAGSVVAEASDGVEAVRCALESRPDVIVMDVNLPELDGFEATARLREELPEAAVIAAVQAGASGYRVKAAYRHRIEELQEELEEAESWRDGERAAAAREGWSSSPASWSGGRPGWS